MSDPCAALEKLYIEALLLKDEGISLLWADASVDGDRASWQNTGHKDTDQKNPDREDMEVRVGRICEAVKFDARLTMVLEHLLCWRHRARERGIHAPVANAPAVSASAASALLDMDRVDARRMDSIAAATVISARTVATMTRDQRRVIVRSLDLTDRVAALHQSGNDDAQRRQMRLQTAYDSGA